MDSWHDYEGEYSSTIVPPYLQAHHAHLRYKKLNIVMGQDILLGYPGWLRQSQVILSYSEHQYLIHCLGDAAGFTLPDHFLFQQAKNLKRKTVTNVKKHHIVTCLYAFYPVEDKISVPNRWTMIIGWEFDFFRNLQSFFYFSCCYLLKQVEYPLWQLEYWAHGHVDNIFTCWVKPGLKISGKCFSRSVMVSLSRHLGN